MLGVGRIAVGPGRLCVVIGVVVLAYAGCGERAALEIGGSCELNSECDSPLVCRLGQCGQECRSSRDCPAGLGCVRDNGLGVCFAQSCVLTSDCPDGLTCSNQQCTNVCERDRDCPPGARCVEDQDGTKGCFDMSESSCARNSDCPSPLICARDKRCRDQCQTDRDCRDGRVCDTGASPRVCVEPGSNPDGGVNQGPVQSVSLLRAGGIHVCAGRSASELGCWGSNGSGQLGVEGTGGSATPIAPNLSPLDVTNIAAGTQFTCVQMTSGLFCWGDNNSGQLGRGFASMVDQANPSAVVGLARSDALAAGRAHTCALTDGTLRCWGANNRGQLGNSSASDPQTAPIEVVGLSGTPVDVVARADHTCALIEDGTVQCWGNGEDGQLGIGTKPSQNGPETVVGLSDAVELAAGTRHVCARRQTGQLVCWGNNDNGRLGTGMRPPASDEELTPAPVSNIVDATDISAGARHTCAVTSRGVECWGDNAQSQIGKDPGMAGDSELPSPVTGLGGASGVTTGDAFSCARVSDTVQCWGSLSPGLGGGPRGTPSHMPITVVWPTS